MSDTLHPAARDRNAAASSASDAEAPEADAPDVNIHDVEYELDGETRIYECKGAFEPGRANRRWAANAFGNPDIQPSMFADEILMEASLLRGDRGDAVGDFLADQLMRLHQLVLWTKSRTPAEHLERMEAWDAEIEAQTYDRGFAAGVEARGHWSTDRYPS
jgi:hypothetical protein